MNKKVIWVAVSTSLSLATPAMAQEVAPVDPFSRFHIEALVGYDVTKAGSTTDDDVNEDNDQSIDGLTYGLGAGYDFRFNNFVVGPEAEVTWSTAKTSFHDGDFEGFGLGNVKTNRDFYVGARFGYVVSPTTMIYAKGGYTNAKFDVNNASGTVETNRDIDSDGWRIGAGIEQAISGRAFAKFEYRYSNYKKGELDYRGDFPDGDRFDLDLDRHQLMAGVGLRF